MRSLRAVVWMTLLVVVLVVPPALADHTTNTQGGGLGEVGFHPLLGTGFNADVWAWSTADDRLMAAVGTWGTVTLDAQATAAVCPSLDDDPAAPTKSGIKILDATDPTDPRLVAQIGTVRGSQNNDVKVIDTPDAALLVHSLEPCGADGLVQQVLAPPPISSIPTAQTGFQVYDVSEPTAPVRRGTYNNGGIGVHNLYPFRRDDLGRTFVAAVWSDVDQVGATRTDLVRSELHIVDITDPDVPVLVSRWGLEDAAAQGGPAKDDMCLPRGEHISFCNLHDVWVSDDGRTVYAPWWDAGLVLLDIADPADPTFIGQIQPGGTDNEVNTHVAVPYDVDGRNYVIVGDEDFVGGATSVATLTVNSPADLAGTYPFAQWDGTPFPDPPITADLAWVGTNRTPLSAVGSQDPAGRIAISSCDRPAGPLDSCAAVSTFAQMANGAAARGALGLVDVSSDEELPGANAVNAPIPAGATTNSAGAPLVDAVIAGETVNVTLGVSPTVVNPWGFMRVVDVTDPDPANWTEVSTFEAPHVRDPSPDPESVFSAHNPLVGPDGRVYFAWYTDGVRVLEPAGGGSFDEVAWFVPRPDDHPDDLEEDPQGQQEDQFGFWGSQAVRHPVTGEILVFNSDFNRGLYVLGYAPDPVGGDPPVQPASGDDGTIPATGGGLALLGLGSLAMVGALGRGHRHD